VTLQEDRTMSRGIPLVLALALVPAAPRADEALPITMEALEARAKELEPRVVDLAERADEVDGLFAHYISACYDRFSGKKWSDRTKRTPEPKHEWLATPVAEFAWQERWVMRLELSGDADFAVERCRTSWKTLATDANDVVEGLEKLEDDARRRSVLPGHLRKMLEEHDLGD
jgi:hypothetical protein